MRSDSTGTVAFPVLDQPHNTGSNKFSLSVALESAGTSAESADPAIQCHKNVATSARRCNDRNNAKLCCQVRADIIGHARINM